MPPALAVTGIEAPNKQRGEEDEINLVHISQRDAPVCPKGFSFHDRDLWGETIPISRPQGFSENSGRSVFPT